MKISSLAPYCGLGGSMGLVWGIAELEMREIQAYHLLSEDLLWRRYDLHLEPLIFILIFSRVSPFSYSCSEVSFQRYP